jgi:hypothetical protein
MQTINGIGTTIYGRANRQELADADRFAAEQAGYLPASYQVVKWFVFLFMPIVPLGTHRVMKAKQKFFTMEFRQYAMQRVNSVLRGLGFEIVPKKQYSTVAEAVVSPSVWLEMTQGGHGHGGKGWEFGTWPSQPR